MPHDTYGASVRCPYYKSHTRTSLVCQWLGGSLVTQRFPSSQRRIRYIRKYCTAWDFGRCPFAAVMNCTCAPWLRPARTPSLDPAKGTKPLWNPHIREDKKEEMGFPAEEGEAGDDTDR